MEFTRVGFLGSHQHQKKLRKAVADFIENHMGSPNRYVLGATLTCKVLLPNAAGGYSRLTRDGLSKEIGFFLRRLELAVFKNAASRFDKYLKRAVTIEGGEGTTHRLHAHILIEWPNRPFRWNWLEFPSLVSSTWRSLDWAGWTIDVDPCVDDPLATGFYFVKEGTDNIDWPNVRV